MMDFGYYLFILCKYLLMYVIQTPAHVKYTNYRLSELTGTIVRLNQMLRAHTKQHSQLKTVLNKYSHE
jgi:hypothetical protein